ncbi:hypothetical protein [Streptomyces sp. NPDC059743]|uniref:hypothetical protein n=1 Tax=Streptomyces sp. NPDC059743 TaxID=3346928 RepID=UPI003649FBD4
MKKFPFVFALALLCSAFLMPGQSAYADTAHGKCPDYRIMDYTTKSWKLTHLDHIGNHTGVTQKYTIVEEVQTHLEASVTVSANASVKAKAAFIADAKIDTGISITGLGSKTKTKSYTRETNLPTGHTWVFYHGRRHVQGVEYGYHCKSQVYHVKTYTAKGKSFSTINYTDAYRCDVKPKDALAKLAVNKGC